VFGKDLLDELVEHEKSSDVQGESAPVHVTAAGAEIQPQFDVLLHQPRLVRDKIILHAISEAYRNILPSGTFPVVIMFVTIPSKTST
jgi:DNA mismatch repair ATPase MutL